MCQWWVARATIKSPFTEVVFYLYVLLPFDFLVPGVCSCSFYFASLFPLPPNSLAVLLLTQGSCAADLYRHPQLDADIEAVKEIYSENSVSIRWGSTSGASHFFLSCRRLEVFLFMV